MRRFRGTVRRLTTLALGILSVMLATIGFVEEQAATYLVTQDQAQLLFYQDGKLSGVEPLAKGTYIRAGSVSSDMVQTTYKGKPAYVQLKFLSAVDSVLVVATDNAELFYSQDGKPAGLEHLPKGTHVTVETRSGDRVFTTHNGKPAYIRNQFLVTTQEFAVATEQEATAAREQAAKAALLLREQAAQAVIEKMERDITRLRAYVLSPSGSHPVGYYDQIITNEFQKFIATYPNSVHEVEVTGRIKEWQAERNRVATGLVRYDGDWVTKADYKKYQKWDQVVALYRDGERLVEQGDWPDAVQKFEATLVLNPGGGTEIATKRQLVAALTKWLAVLQRNRQDGSSNQTNLRKTPQQVQAKVDQAHKQQDQIKRSIEQIKQRLGRDDLKVVQPNVATAGDMSADQTQSESPDIMARIQIWFSQYWAVAIGVVLLGLLLLGRVLQ